MRPLRLVALALCSLVSAVVLACGESASAPAEGSDADASVPVEVDAATPGTDADTVDAPASPPDARAPLRPCASTGARSYTGPGTCSLVTPIESGAGANGANASDDHYAIAAPPAKAKSRLLLYLPGTGGAPAGVLAAGSERNFYAAAAAAGLDVLALAYANDTTIATLCKADADCFFASRKAVILGVAQPGAAAALASIRDDEGIVTRAVLVLKALAARDTSWSRYLGTGTSPETRLAWSKITVAGHSQGGGHAAAIGKLFAVERVIQLASTCDAVMGGTPIAWTSSAAGPWATDPTQFYGLAAPTVFDDAGAPVSGDTICAYHVANWRNLGMVASHQHDDAATCGVTGNTHGASIGCADNYAQWGAMLE